MNRLYFVGLDLDEWDRWPEDIVDEAEPIVTTHVLGAQTAIAAAYPLSAQALATDLTHTIERDGHQILASVTNPHPLAWIFDHGTMARHTETGAGRGSTKPQHVFVPRAYEWARQEYLALAAMLERFGLSVSGEMDDEGRIA